MEAFTLAVKTGSFTAAAEQLGLSKSYVSKQVSQLESDLGVRLLYRTTRKLSLSHDGEQFYQHCKLIMEEADKAKAEAMDSHDKPSGIIKLTIPQSFVLSQAGAVLIKFQHEYPNIELEIQASGSNVDLIEESIDLALRIGELEDSTMMCRKLMDCEFQVVAAQKYLEQHGVPSQPKELTQHNCLVYSGSQLNRQWPFRLPSGETMTVNVQGNLGCNDGQYILNGALNGLGICFGPSIMFKYHLDKKELCLLLEDYYLPSVSISAIYPLNRNLSRRVRLLIDFLAEELSR
ncbi:MAG: LysR family transcriptional regulator [Gammaproteobacteria bacterium]|nr:LysR family transcriptional regulator [Gammaproteobacteria bacterium]